MADTRDPKDEGKKEELKTFQTEYRRLIGGAIINGLITPRVAGSITDITIGDDGGLAKDYDQDSGNYTQLAGDHEQNSGNYDQQ